MQKIHAAIAAAALTLSACMGDPVEPTAPRERSQGKLARSPSPSRTVVVTESDIARQAENTPPTRDWVLYTRAAGNGAFRTGPGKPPSGVGSFELTTPTAADKATLFNFDHMGTELADIDAMSYRTYRTSGAAQQVAAINIQVDINGAAPGGFTTLVFEPVYNTNQGAVVSGTWQYWDAYKGGQAIWWSSNPIPGAPNRDTFVTWETILATNPDAVIIGGYGANQGSGNPGLVTAVDLLTIGYNGTLVRYNFEPLASDLQERRLQDGKARQRIWVQEPG